MTDKKPDSLSVLSHSDGWTGFLLFVVGATAAWMATGFDEVSRTYPLVLGLLLVVLGLVLGARAHLGLAQHVSFGIPMQVVFPTAIILGAWVGALINGLGYIIPTFAMQFAFMTLGGVKGPGRIAVFAALISVISYLVFIVVLKVRLPSSIAPWLL